MAESLYGTIAPTTNYILNNYNYRKFDEDNYLVTTEHGSWVLLSKEEFDLLRLHKAEENPLLFSELEKKGIILTLDNIKKVISNFRERNHFMFSAPTLHIIIPTLRCNQKCIYCHSRAKPDSGKKYDLDRDKAKKIVDFILSVPVDSLTIEFQGGDCILNYGTTEFIIDYAKEKAKEKSKKVLFSLVTNLTLMDRSILDSLAKRKVRGIATSFDGPREVHDRNRKYLGGKGTYEDVVHWIEIIKSEYKNEFNLNALATITRHSLGYGREIVDEYIKRGFLSLWLRPLNNIGFAADSWKKIGYSAEEYLNFYNSTLDYIIEVNKNGTELREMMTTIFLKKVLSNKDPQMVDIESPCGAGIGQVLYNYNGDIHTCDEAKLFPEFKLGNVETSSFWDIIDNEITVAMMDVSSKKGYLCDACVWNPYCGICPIYTYAAQGTIVSKLAKDAKCKTYNGILTSLFKKLLFSEEDRKVLLTWIKRGRLF